ncbi:hypothetical protein [Parasitella parasitica]|uniref:Uncharacterized protein n=1 Tax=Parasitella parasitica TaxID=35722 RepID=A0A0B7NW39_9FUNG|nr:hypothetical protein [Parasitella parasitica]
MEVLTNKDVIPSSKLTSSPKKKSLTVNKTKTTDTAGKEQKQKKKKVKAESYGSDLSIKETKKKIDRAGEKDKPTKLKKKKGTTVPNTQQDLAKQQAETLRKAAASLKKPELASNPNAGGNSALRLRLDLNLDADIKLKAKIKGSVKLTLL